MRVDPMFREAFCHYAHIPGYICVCFEVCRCFAVVHFFVGLEWARVKKAEFIVALLSEIISKWLFYSYISH
jgi:hypothetical protein